jgi:hypothetical protein
MKIFKLFRGQEEIRTRSNRHNIYVTLKDAKTALILFLRHYNRKIKDKNLQLKSEECTVEEFKLEHSLTHRL